MEHRIDADYDNRVGVLLVFKSGVEAERVQRWVDALRAKGVLDDENVHNAVEEFDGNWGFPTFYIP